MQRSFYHFVMTLRGAIKVDELSTFADSVFHDHSFPKQSSDYDEISSYLEMHSYSLDTMRVFDRAWELYKSDDK